MEQEIARLLEDTQSAQDTRRKTAELHLKQLYTNDNFPLALLSIGAHDVFSLNTRQSAILYLKTFVQSVWSPQFEEYKGQSLVSIEGRKRLRQVVLELATSEEQERKVKSAASIVVSKIASADFPDEWPDLLPTLLHVINNGTPGQLHGALKVLQDLVDDCFTEDQFFSVARDLVSTVYGVAVNEARPTILRALAVSVFRSCFDILEMVMEDHRAAVKGFAEETLNSWSPFFVSILKAPFPPAPSDDDEDDDSEGSEQYRGMVALKLQVVKSLMKIRSVFPAALGPQSLVLFSATWDELNNLQHTYHQMYIEDDRQGRLEDADGLPYTLDFLVLEELDFMQACIRAPIVRKELDLQLKNQTGPETWITEVMKVAVSYAQITTEEEGLWDIDVNIFLSEEANVTANYTPRTACGDLVIKLGEWQRKATIDGLLHHTRSLYSGDSSWKSKEAALYILNQLLGDMLDVEQTMASDAANGYIDFVRHAMQQEDPFLRARGYLAAGSLTRTSPEALHPVAVSLMESSLHAVSSDPSEIVRVSCIRALQSYLAAIPPTTTLIMQPAIIAAIQDFLSQQDMSDMDDCEDIMIAIVETLRDAILLDARICVTGSGLDVLFTIASRGASNFQIAMLITETFEEVSSTLAATGPEMYAQLCAKVIPSLSGAFDIGNITQENALTNLAADMLAVLAENGSSPLPQGFVVTTMPKLNRLLLESADDELLKSATCAVKYMLQNDPDQMFSWQNADGKGGLEVILIIIDRLLNPHVDDNAAAEVGGLAAELVEKAGADRLGPYLTQLLGAVAMRLSTARNAQFIQSLILVFARLSLTSPREVIDFLMQLRIGSDNGLQVVMSKWLENSINFAGYDEIRQNVIALTKLYDLGDPRLSQVHVKGDLIVPQSDRIMTRSRARQNPDQYTVIPASLKVVKVLVEELLSASGANQNMEAAAAAGLDDEGSDDGDWEDESNPFLDLGAGVTKEQLMAYAADDAPTRGRDDKTQSYLTQWFHSQATKPAFAGVFNSLTQDEQEKLRNMS